MNDFTFNNIYYCYNTFQLVWLLLRSGACRNCLNNSGKRPVDLCSVQCVAIRSLLESSVIPESYSATEDSIQLSPRSQISVSLSKVCLSDTARKILYYIIALVSVQ